jgi:hypothetical protein
LFPTADNYVVLYERATLQDGTPWGGFSCISIPTQGIEKYNEFFRRHKK